MKNFNYFESIISPFEYYSKQKKELDRQINEYIVIMHGRSQPCHCESEAAHKECQEYDFKMKEKQEKLAHSIRLALDLV